MGHVRHLFPPITSCSVIRTDSLLCLTLFTGVFPVHTPSLPAAITGIGTNTSAAIYYMAEVFKVTVYLLLR